MREDIKEIMLTEEQIQSKVKELAAALSEEYAGKDPVFVGVLKGVVVFFADMVRNLTIPCESPTVPPISVMIISNCLV